jgi:cell wall-associated NlpC family hydrolase
MWAWNAGGVSLSHSAQAQYNETTRVSTDNLQPGDLVFFGSSTSNIGHNAIYVGGGMMVEAPHTGLNVREVGAFRSDLVGAGRPG